MSGHENGSDIDVEVVASGDSGSDHVESQRELLALAEAVHARDERAITIARKAVTDALGLHAAIDACAVIAAFHGLNVVADAIGCQISAEKAEARREVHDALGY